MKFPMTTGRRLGILFLLHLITGLLAPYILLHSLATARSFGETASINSFQVRLAVILLFIGGALTIAIAVTAWPVFRAEARSLAIWVIALATVNFALQCIEIAGYMSMFSFSQEYANAASANITLYDAVWVAVRSAWKWPHYTHLLVMVSWMFVMFLALWRTTLVPKVLAGLAMLTALMQITGITLPQFIPYPSPPAMLMGIPLAFAYAALAVWLIVKGFKGNDAVIT
jgi:uncharacterized protein DUF4386